MKMTLPASSADRKQVPLNDGCLAYFPAALAAVALVSKEGNDQHNPGQPLHHARGKSMDHKNCIQRHLTDVNDLMAGIDRNEKGAAEAIGELCRESARLAWRALALCQQIQEDYAGAPLAPAAKLPAAKLPEEPSEEEEPQPTKAQCAWREDPVLGVWVAACNGGTYAIARPKCPDCDRRVHLVPRGLL